MEKVVRFNSKWYWRYINFPIIIDDEPQYCPVCAGIIFHWNKLTQEWNAPHVDGGVYCTCSKDGELALAKGSIEKWK